MIRLKPRAHFGFRISDFGLRLFNPQSTIRNPQSSCRGQVIIEFAMSLTGLVMLIYVFVKTWGWLSGMIVQRQSHFQTTRVAAGQVGTAGQEVGYTREPLKLVGLAGSTGGDGLGFPSIPVPAPPCDAAKAFYDQAQTHFYQASLYQQEAKPYLDYAAALAAEAEALTDQLDFVNSRLADIAHEIADLEACSSGGGDDDENT